MASTATPGLPAPTFRRQITLSILLSGLLLIALAEVGSGGALFASARPNACSIPEGVQKRLVLLRHNDTAEGSRCIVTSDSQLDDYSAYVEGERFLVRLPLTKLLAAHDNSKGRGFADLRAEEKEEDVIISFRLQPGASVSVNQSFNRLEIDFLTNEGAKEVGDAK